MNLSAILKDEAIILFIRFQCAIDLLKSIYFPRTVKVFMDVNYLTLRNLIIYVQLVYFMAENYTLYFSIVS